MKWRRILRTAPVLPSSRPYVRPSLLVYVRASFRPKFSWKQLLIHHCWDLDEILPKLLGIMPSCARRQEFAVRCSCQKLWPFDTVISIVIFYYIFSYMILSKYMYMARWYFISSYFWLVSNISLTLPVLTFNVNLNSWITNWYWESKLNVLEHSTALKAR